MKRARGKATAGTRGKAVERAAGTRRPRAAALNAALLKAGGGAHGKSEKALRRAARVALRKAEDDRGEPER
jgi:hypothetical protein